MKINKNYKIVAILSWLYTIEATTFYIKSNIIDNIFQLICIIIMGLSLLFNIKNLYIPKIIRMYVVLLILGILPDILNSKLMLGTPVMISHTLPLCMFIYVYSKYRSFSSLSCYIFKIPIIYGAIISLMGFILEISNFVGIPINVWVEEIGKTGNTISMCSIIGIPMGAYSSWGSFMGKNLLRIQGFYIEPSKMAMFLIIPIFLSYGIYKNSKLKRYLFIFYICLVCFFFTMSRAGLISIVSSLFIGWIYKAPIKINKKILYKATQKDIFKGIIAIIGAIIGGVILLSCLVYISKFFPKMEFLYIGITDIEGKVKLIRSETVNSSLILRAIIQQPYGYGFSNMLHNDTTSLNTNLANALILWLVTSGILGMIVAISIMIILTFKYCIPCLKSEDNIKNSIGKVFIGLSIHSLSYGTWMTQEIILSICIMILATQKLIKKDW